MTDDLKNFSAPEPLLPKVLFALILAGLAVAAMVIQDNAAVLNMSTVDTVDVRGSAYLAGNVAGYPPTSETPNKLGAAPYTTCPKLRNGKWLRSEIAHWRKDGWEVTCSYWGQELETRDQARL